MPVCGSCVRQDLEHQFGARLWAPVQTQTASVESPIVPFSCCLLAVDTISINFGFLKGSGHTDKEKANPTALVRIADCIYVVRYSREAALAIPLRFLGLNMLSSLSRL